MFPQSFSRVHKMLPAVCDKFVSVNQSSEVKVMMLLFDCCNEDIQIATVDICCSCAVTAVTVTCSLTMRCLTSGCTIVLHTGYEVPLASKVALCAAVCPSGVLQ